MIRRSLLVVGLLATLFSARADLMYYTFEGSVSNVFGTANTVTIGEQATYVIALDFDMPSKYAGNLYNDGSTVYSNFTLSNDYAIANLVGDGLYQDFPNNLNLNYYSTNSLASTQIKDYVDPSMPNTYFSQIYITSYDDNSKFHELYLSGSNSFSINSVFTFEESYVNNGEKTAGGSLTLRSISSLPISSVPEPGCMVMLASGLLMLSGMGLRRKA